MHRAAEHHDLPIDLGLGQFILEGVHHRFRRNRIRRAVDRQYAALDVAGRAGNDRIGIGDMEDDYGLEIRAGARLFEGITAARAIADRPDLCRVGDAELLASAKSVS